MLEQRKKTRDVTSPNTGQPIDHNSTAMPADMVAQCFENVRMSIVDKAIQYALSDRFGATDLSTSSVAKKRNAYMLQSLQQNAGSSQAEASGDAEEPTNEQKRTSMVLRRMKSSYFTQTEGMRADNCGDVEFGKPYGIFHKVTPPTWINGDVLDHGGTSVIPIFDDKTRDPTILGGGATHSVTGCVSMGDEYVHNDDSEESNRPLKQNKNTEAYFRRYLELTKPGGQMDFARYRVPDTWKAKRFGAKQNRAFMKLKVKVFYEKWLVDFPDASLVRFNIPMSKFAGHCPHIEIVQTLLLGRADAQQDSADTSEDSGSESDSDDDTPFHQGNLAENYDPDVYLNAAALDADSEDAGFLLSSDDSAESSNDEEDDLLGEDASESAAEEASQDDPAEGASSSLLDIEDAQPQRSPVSYIKSSESEDEESDEAPSPSPIRRKKKRKRKSTSNASQFLDLEAAADDSNEDELEDEDEAQEQRELDAEMIKGSDESESEQSDVDEFASRAAVDRMLEERDNKRKMEEEAQRNAKRRRVAQIKFDDSDSDEED